MNDDTAIIAQGLSKEFHLPHEQADSVKNIFTNLIGYISKSRTYETQQALKNITFEVKKGEFFGIVGRNGSGKSTLLKIIAGIYQPSKGKIAVSGKLVPFIELGVGFNPELTGRENIYLNGALMGFSQKEVQNMYNEIVEFAELERFMDQKLKNYSSGMQVRLAFSLAIRAETDILLIDEVLAVGDADFQRKCFSYFKDLKAKHKTVVFVTHDMNSVKEYCDRAMLINDSKIQLIGKPQDAAREYAQLFMGQADPAGTSMKSTKRWGNGDLRIKDVRVSLQKNEVVFDVKAVTNKPLERVIYGLHVLGQDGVELTAMNNRMIHAPDLTGLKKGDEVRFQWRMLNVFSDGVYSVTLTLIDDIQNSLDWFTEAATFTVKREERSTTAVLPPVEVTHTVSHDKAR